MSRALWWFRWGAVVTVLVGLAYWGNGIVGVDASNGRGAGYAGASAGHVMGTFFLIWTIVFAVMYAADRKSTRLNSSHGYISYAAFCLKKKNTPDPTPLWR